MGACGCYGANGIYKLLAKDGWYFIVLSPPCSYCVNGGGIILTKVDFDKIGVDESDVPTLEIDEDGIMFACSLGIEEMKEVMKKALVGYTVGDTTMETTAPELDETDAEVLAESVMQLNPNWPVLWKVEDDE